MHSLATAAHGTPTPNAINTTLEAIAATENLIWGHRSESVLQVTRVKVDATPKGGYTP